MILIDCL